MLVESCTSTDVRPRPSISLPERGPFLFPEPYGTTGIRITNADDGPILPAAYSYWQAINAHADQDHLLIMLRTPDPDHGGGGPSLWRVDKGSLTVTPLGPLFPPTSPLSYQTGEWWHWSATDPDILYVTDFTHLYQLHVSTRLLEVILDLSAVPIRTDEILWQMHTSHDGRVHSATVKAGDSRNWLPLGAVVYPWSAHCWFPAIGDYDECQVDRSGEWLLIKEVLPPEATPGLVRPPHAEDNRIIRLADGYERRLLDEHGAAGHSDCGYGYMVAADNFYPDRAEPAAWRVWPFDESQTPQGRVVYYAHEWETQVNHVSHCNAQPGPPEGQWVLGSGATDAVGPRANELLMIPLDGSLRVGVIAPNLTAPGAGYDDLPKASLDNCGQYAIWTANGHGRRDAFLVIIPDDLR